MKFLFILYFILCTNTIISADEISPGSTLYASSPDRSWNSPNEIFSISFVQEPGRNAFFAAVIYNGVPVWKAGGDPGGAVDYSAALHFRRNGNLELVTGSPPNLIWQSQTSGLGISSAVLDDSGNFILKNKNSPIWTSFDNPTDTILPGQNFTVHHALRFGLYSFHLFESGEIRLQWNGSVVYYTNSTTHKNLTSPSLGMVVGILSLFDPMLSSPVVMARASNYDEMSNDTMSFLKLDDDGNLRIYSSSPDGERGKKDVTWTAISDQCRVYGYCGSMGICSYDPFTFTPVCDCPSRNFIPIVANDIRKGCKLVKDCDQTVMMPLDNTIFLTYPPESYHESSIRSCQSNCLSNTMCNASSYFSDGICYSKTSGFVSGYKSPTITSTSYVKVCEPIMPNPPFALKRLSEKSCDGLKVTIVVLSSCLVILILLCGFMWLYCGPCGTNSKNESVFSSPYSLSDYASCLPVQFSYKELQKATKGFKEKLGEGGFGSVYKGVLSNKLVVAVKRLEGIEQGEKQFRMEVATISSTHHLNLVRLTGFCSERRHRLLVYEFMKNGSLENFLFASTSRKRVLNWENRYKIALGTAKGITYLHEECRDRILHGDIKPENILLDENYNARVSDFGLARLLNLNDRRQRSLISVSGTRGYLAPEWLANQMITSKADVYSYGMVLLEMVSGRRNFEVSTETSHKKFSLWAYDEFEKGNLGRIIDKRLMDEEVDMVQVMRACQVSFWCIQEQPLNRPVMGKVVQMLEGIVEIDQPPPPLIMVEKLVQPAIVAVSTT